MTSLAEAFGLGRGCFGREGVLRGTGTFPETGGLRKADLDSSILELEVDRLHMPGVIETEPTGVVRRQCIYPGNLRQQNHLFDEPVPRK